MNQFIVDTSIVVQFVVADTHTPNVKHLFQQLNSEDELIVPEFCLLECTNVLWKYVRFHGTLPATASALVDDLTALPLTIHTVSGYLKRALEIGLKYNLAIYDSVYLAMAEQLKIPLISDDSKQSLAASSEGIALKDILDFKP